MAVLSHVGWKNVIFLYSPDDYGIGARTNFLNLANLNSMTAWYSAWNLHFQDVSVTAIALSASSMADYSQQIETIKASKVHVFVLFCQTDQGTDFIIQAK